MPSKHSKNAATRGHYTYGEKHGHKSSSTQRFGTDSQLPFGYCCLSTNPALEPVITPSGHLYEREAILEYLLAKTKELKELERVYEEQQALEAQKRYVAQERVAIQEIAKFAQSQHSATTQLAGATAAAPVSSLLSSSSGSAGGATMEEQDRRKRKFDDRDNEVKLAEMKKICPWVAGFTPHAEDALLKAPPKRPGSPFSGQPLRVKDLIPVNLVRESSTASSRTGNCSSSSSSSSSSATDCSGRTSSTVRFICPVSRKTITNQKVVVIKSTSTLMLESTAKDLAYPTMVCPMTGKKFKKEDVVELVSAASGFSASGVVEGKQRVLKLN